MIKLVTVQSLITRGYGKPFKMKPRKWGGGEVGNSSLVGKLGGFLFWEGARILFSMDGLIKQRYFVKL